MKFYDFVIAQNGYDLSGFEKYAVYGSPKKGILVLKFCESDIVDVLERLYNSFKRRDTLDIREYIDISYFLGSDGYLYKYADGIPVKFQKLGFIRFFINCLITNSRSNKILKTQKRTLRRKKRYDNSAVIKKFSVLPYKALEYYCKEHNIAFKYRFKKASGADKPLVIYMAGAGCLGYDNFKQLYECYVELHKQLKDYDCSILIPQSPCQNFYSNPTVFDYIDAVIDLIGKVCDDVSADKKRIYLIGTSYGGFCTWEMIYRSPDRFACGVPVMGDFIFFDRKADNVDFEHFLSTPLWVAHSSDDDNVKIDSDDTCVAELKKLGADVRYTRWEKYGHKMSSKFYKQEPWAEWMFRQVKK